MIKSNIHHASANIPSTHATTKNASSNNIRSRVTASSRTTNVEFIDYTALDTFRRETVFKEEETNRTWKAKYDPWLIDEYREMYKNLSKNRVIPSDNRVISLDRSEWRQPANTLPPLYTRLPGQRRRRLLGSFPETENDKIGWRLLPEHAIDIYGSSTANIPPLPRQYKFSSWPVESFH